MTNLRISHPDGRTEDVDTTDSFGTMENMFPDQEIMSEGRHYWIEDMDVTADEYDD